MDNYYSPKKIEKKWQDIWDENKAFAATMIISKQSIMHW